MNVICNTTPFIALASIGKVEFLHEIYSSLLIPQAVVDELEAGGDIQVPKLATLEWVTIVPNINTYEDHLLFQLDYGEKHVVLNALKLKADLVLIDDRTARNIAEYFGLTVKGTLGVLVEAKRKRLISAFKSLAKEMQKQGIRFSDRLIDEIAIQLGEQ